jgi:Mg2+ and Co2+ transporter CorA
MPTETRVKKYRQRIRRMEIHFSDGEMKAFEARSKEENVKVGVLIKNMAIAYLRSETLPTPKELEKIGAIEKELIEISLYIRNIANNVNQIAHRSNTLKVMVDEHEFLMHLKNLDDTLRENINKFRKS